MYELGPGPWDNEPDRIEFTSRVGGLPCLMRRTQMGAWCGYVAVTRDHPCYGKGMSDLQFLEAHGGITYGHGCTGEICHVPKEGESDDVWWIGFDCAHAWDLIPWMVAQRKKDDWPTSNDELSTVVLVSGYRLGSFIPQEEYRDAEYVREQCEELAAQLEQLR